MKKIFFIIGFVLMSCLGYSQSTPLSTILTWFETHDVPTQAQFETAWRNSYNAVTDGVFNLNGYPAITVDPYSSFQNGKFYWATTNPTDTTYSLAFGGVLRVARLYSGGNLITGAGSYFSRTGNEVSLTNTSDRLAIRSATTSGYDLYVGGRTYSSESIGTNRLDLENISNDQASVSIDAFGNLSLEDANAGILTLSDIGGASAWIKINNVVSTLLATDTVTIGGLAPTKDSLFNVYGTAYFGSPVFFDSTVVINSIISTDEYLVTPSVNFSYGGNSGRIDLYTTGKLKFYDVDYPSGKSLSELIGYFTINGTSLYPTLATSNLALGTTNPLGYKLYVLGNSLFNGSATFNNGVNIINTQRLSWPLSYITESGGVLRFYDPVTGEKTLADLATGGAIIGDSLSVSILNTDTLYFNGQQTKKMFSPNTNNIYIKNQNAVFSFEYKNPMAILGLGALRFEPSHDSLKSSPGWEEQGKFILRDVDTTFQYATGKASEWRTIATEEWVTATLNGLGGLNLALDTLYFNGNVDFLTGDGSHAIKFFTTSGGGIALDFVTGASPGIISNNNSVLFSSSYLILNHAAGNLYYDATYLRSVADTMATRAYARSFGGTGGGGSIDIYPDAQPDTIVTASGDGFAYFATNLFSGNYSFITGYPGTADSVKLGRKVQITNNYSSETAVKYSQKLFQDYDGGYIDAYSKVYNNYTDANANSGDAYGVFSTLYTNKNYASTGNTSYSNAGKFILQNRGTVQIGGASSGTVYLNGVYSGISGTFDTTSTPGTYRLAAIYGKNSNAGNAKGWAGYFDGNVKIVGYSQDNVLKATATPTPGYWHTGTTYPSSAYRLNFNGALYAYNVYSAVSINDYMAFTLGTTLESVANGTTRLLFNPSVSNGSTAVPYMFDTRNTMSTTGSLLASFRNAGTQKAYIDKDGKVSANGGFYSNAVGDTAVYGVSTTSYGGIFVTSSGIGLQTFSGTGTALNVAQNGSTTSASTLFNLNRAISGSGDATGNIIAITDNPTNSGTKSGKIFTANIGVTERITMNPRVTNGSSSVAYLWDTHEALTGNARAFQVKNNGTEKFYIKNDTSVFTNDLRFRGNLYEWKYRAFTDTFSVVMYPGGRFDTASFYFSASKAWEDKLEPFEYHFENAKRLKSLPLPYPDGTIARKPNELFFAYQFEYELERLTRYLKDAYDKINALNDRITQLEYEKPPE